MVGGPDWFLFLSLLVIKASIGECGQPRRYCSQEQEDIAKAVMDKAEAHYSSCGQPKRSLERIHAEFVQKRPPNRLISLLRDLSIRSKAHDATLRKFVTDAAQALVDLDEAVASGYAFDSMECTAWFNASVAASYEALVGSVALAGWGHLVESFAAVVWHAAGKFCERAHLLFSSSPRTVEHHSDFVWHAHMELWKLYAFEQYYQHALWIGRPRPSLKIHFNDSVGISHEMQHHMFMQGIARPRMVEVGVLWGDGAEMVLAALPDLQYIGVDPYPDERDAVLFDGHRYENTEMRLTAGRLRLQQFGRRAQLLWATTADVAPWIANGSLDYVFIDGDHAYEAVVFELRSWIPKLREGGIIAGHDYIMLYPSLITAVHEVFQEYPPDDGVLNLSPGNVFFWQPGNLRPLL